LYDAACPGLYVCRNTSGVVTFNMKGAGKIGCYDRATFDIEAARDTYRAAKTGQFNPAAAVKKVTINDAVEARIAWMRKPERKGDGEERAQIETWKNTASTLKRTLGEKIGHKRIAEVTRHDLIAIQNDMPTPATKRHFKRATTGFFNWAVEQGMIEVSPAILPKLRTEPSRERALTPEEIKAFWRGLDRDDLPTGRKTLLAMRFALATMLRSGELLPLQRSEVFLDAEIPYVLIPARRVKKRRDIKCPLSWLAIEILREAMADGSEFVFGTDKAPSCHIMADALRGRPDKGKGVGICQILGLESFTGHDLRRSAATIAGKLGIADSWI
jgi:integrase